MAPNHLDGNEPKEPNEFVKVADCPSDCDSGSDIDFDSENERPVATNEEDPGVACNGTCNGTCERVYHKAMLYEYCTQAKVLLETISFSKRSAMRHSKSQQVRWPWLLEWARRQAAGDSGKGHSAELEGWVKTLQNALTSLSEGFGGQTLTEVSILLHSVYSHMLILLGGRITWSSITTIRPSSS